MSRASRLGAVTSVVVGVLSTVLLAGPAPAETPPQPPDLVFNADTRTVRVPVSVLDETGQPILGLESRDFTISENGKPQSVTLFSGERRPLRIALALDLSRSMENKIQQVRQALGRFIDLLEPADQILVITFSEEPQIVQDFTSDRAVLRGVLDKLQPEGGTSLYDAVYDAIDKVASASAESKAVVIVTDGVDTLSAVSFKRVRELARRSEVPVFSIGVDIPESKRASSSGPPVWPGGGWGGRGGFPGRRGGWGGGGGWPGGWGGASGNGSEPQFDAGPLKDLADDTGGRAIIIKAGAEHGDAAVHESLNAAVDSIATTLRHRYLLGYDPPPGKGEFRTIRVAVDRPGATARTRKGYYAGE